MEEQKFQIKCDCGNTLTVYNDLEFEFNFEPTWPIGCKKCDATLRAGYNLGEKDRPFKD